MTTSVGRETAKIYVFPVKARMSGTGGNRVSRPGASDNAERLPMTDFGSGWYHGAAIRESVRPSDSQG